MTVNIAAIKMTSSKNPAKLSIEIAPAKATPFCPRIPSANTNATPSEASATRPSPSLSLSSTCTPASNTTMAPTATTTIGRIGSQTKLIVARLKGLIVLPPQFRVRGLMAEEKQPTDSADVQYPAELWRDFRARASQSPTVPFGLSKDVEKVPSATSARARAPSQQSR